MNALMFDVASTMRLSAARLTCQKKSGMNVTAQRFVTLWLANLLHLGSATHPSGTGSMTAGPTLESRQFDQSPPVPYNWQTHYSFQDVLRSLKMFTIRSTKTQKFHESTCNETRIVR